MDPATLSSDGAATPRPLGAPRPARRAALRAAAIALAALAALLLLHAYRQPGFLIDFANLRLC